MNKYKKFDENLDIFPDVTIEPIESIMEGNDDEEESKNTTPSVRREQQDIFNNKDATGTLSEGPVISKDEPSEIINDVPDKMETMDNKRKGRGKAKKKYATKPRTEKQLAVLEKARLARKLKAEKKAKNNIKMEVTPIIQTPTPTAREPAPTIIEEPIKKNITDFAVFCEYMNKYNTNREQMRTTKEQTHPNKLVKKNLLPRPPLIKNEKNNVEKIKKKVQIMEQPRNIYDPGYALRMLTNRSTKNRFKDPFNR